MTADSAALVLVAISRPGPGDPSAPCRVPAPLPRTRLLPNL